MSASKSMYFGSGTIYEMKFTDDIVIPTTPAEFKTFVETYCTTANQLGYLKNGFKFTLTATNLEDQSDLGEMKVSTITDEKGQMDFALFNANGETISRMYPTAKTVNKVTTIGGLANAEQDDHLIIYVSANKNADGENQVFVGVGRNASGFNINWAPKSVEPFGCQYTCMPFNTDGNICRIAEVADLPALPIKADTVFNITFNTNGGEWAASYEVPESYVHGTGSDITLPTSSNITKEDCTFVGWFETTDLATAVTEIDVSEDSGNKTYYAKWTTA